MQIRYLCHFIHVAFDKELQLAVAEWFRHYATNLKVASSIPDDVIFKFT
jgi:hypothetical protein